MVKILSGCGETADEIIAWAKPLLEMSKGPARSMSLMCKLSNPEPLLLLLACASRRHYSSALIIARHQATGDSSSSSKSTKLFKQANPKLFLLPCLACGNPNQGSGLNLPLVSVFCLLSTLVSFLCDTAQCAMPPVSRTSDNKLCCFLSLSPVSSCGGTWLSTS